MVHCFSQCWDILWLIASELLQLKEDLNHLKFGLNQVVELNDCLSLLLQVLRLQKYGNALQDRQRFRELLRMVERAAVQEQPARELRASLPRHPSGDGGRS